MPRPPKCDVEMAKKVALILCATLPSTCKGEWLAGNVGERCFLPYVCSNMTDDPTDWANLEAAHEILASLVPLIRQKTLHEKTSEMAVALVINTMKLTENIEPASENEVKWQAYKLRSMISHLRRLRREAKSKDGRKTEKRSGLVALALQLNKIANTGVPAGKANQTKNATGCKARAVRDKARQTTSTDEVREGWGPECTRRAAPTTKGSP